MPSVDISSYITLDLVDKDPQDIYDTASQYLTTQFPDLTLREGMMETVLVEAVALEVAESVFAINRLPDSMTEVLLQFFGVTRDIGQPPTADIVFTVSGPQGATIPGGSSFSLDTGTGMDPLLLVTDADLVIPMGSTTGVTSATGSTFTDLYNGTPSGTLLVPQQSLLYVNTAALASSVTEGRDPEDDETYLSRGVQSLQKISTTLSTPNQFVAAALEFPFVGRALGLDAYNPDNDPDGNGPVGADPGYMCVAVYGDNELVPDDEKSTLQDSLDGDAMANLFIKLIDPTITPIAVEANIAIQSGVDDESVVSAVTTAIQAALNPMSWGWGNIVRRSTLLSLISNVAGVDYVDSLVTPATDIALSGVANLVSCDPSDININPLS